MNRAAEVASLDFLALPCFFLPVTRSVDSSDGDQRVCLFVCVCTPFVSVLTRSGKEAK